MRRVIEAKRIAAVIRALAVAIAAVGVLGGAACGGSTAELSPALQARFASEGIIRSADDADFRYTRNPGGGSQRWEVRRASIVLTDSTLFIHKNDKVGLEVTSRTRKDVSVERSGDRVRIRSGRGRSEEIWSFLPPSDAQGWAVDIRKLMKRASGG